MWPYTCMVLIFYSTPGMLFCDATMYIYEHSTALEPHSCFLNVRIYFLLNVTIIFLIRLGSYRPQYDDGFSAKERVILLSGHPNGDTQLLNLGTVYFTHVKAARCICSNLKIKITFLLKFPVCAISRTIFSRLNGLSF